MHFWCVSFRISLPISIRFRLFIYLSYSHSPTRHRSIEVLKFCAAYLLLFAISTSVQCTYTIQRLVIVCVSVSMCLRYSLHTMLCLLNAPPPLHTQWIVAPDERWHSRRENKKFNDNSQKLAITTLLLCTWVFFCVLFLLFFLHLLPFLFAIPSFRTAYQNGKFNWKKKLNEEREEHGTFPF